MPLLDANGIHIQELLAVKQENHGIKQKLDELEITNRGLTVAVGRASGPNTEAIEADIHQADLEFKDAIKTAHKTFIGKIHDAVSSRGHDGRSTPLLVTVILILTSYQ